MRLKPIVSNIITLVIIEVLSRKTTSYLKRRLGLTK